MGKSEEGSSGPTFAGCPVESLGFGDLAKQEVLALHSTITKCFSFLEYHF